MNIQRKEYLLRQFFNQASTDKEWRELALLINESDDDELNELLEKAWNSLNVTHRMPEDMSGRILSLLTNWNIDTENAYTTGAVREKKPAVFRIRRWIAVAAVFILVPVALLWIYQHASSPKRPQTNTLENVPVTHIRNIVLPDGSTVVLHAGSSLRYDSAFDTEKQRMVTLSGEAYFNIRPDPGRPFIIYTGNVRTTVLGTAFNIKAYPGEPVVVVSVTRGKVRVEDKKQLVAVLTPQQQVIYNTGSSTAVQQTRVIEDVTAWTKEDMNFIARPLKTILQALSTRYDTEIRLGNKASGNCLVTASFSGKEPLAEVIGALCTILGNTFETTGDGAIIVNGNSCGPSRAE